MTTELNRAETILRSLPPDLLKLALDFLSYLQYKQAKQPVKPEIKPEPSSPLDPLAEVEPLENMGYGFLAGIENDFQREDGYSRQEEIG